MHMTRMTYTKERYETISREEMDEGTDYEIGNLEPTPQSLTGVRLALLLGPSPEEPEIVVPLDFLRASGAQVDVIAPWWTPRDWLPAARFWTPTLKINYQQKFPKPEEPRLSPGCPIVDDYGGVWT
jgi:hypothetical protein